MAYDFSSNGIYYKITSETALTVEVTRGGNYNYIVCSYSGNVDIPEKVNFNGKKYTVTRIGDFAFATQNSSTVIDEYAYRLKSITMPNSIESIGDRAFWWCDALKEVIIPQSVKKIEDNAFAGCHHIENCYILSENPPITDFGYNINSFRDEYDIYVPNKAIYLSDKTWKQYGDRIKEFASLKTSIFEYSGHIPSLSFTNNLKNYDLEVTLNNSNKNAGIYSIPVRFKYSRDHEEVFAYDISYDYQIDKKALTLDINDATRLYGEENPTFTYKNLSGFVDGENIKNLDNKPMLSVYCDKHSDVGSYYINATLTDKNYNLNIGHNGKLTIEKAPLTVKVCNFNKKYGEAVPTNLQYEYEGLKNEEETISASFNINTTAEKYSDVGEYSIYVSNGLAKNYYFEKYIPGTLTITPAPLIIKVDYKCKTYGDPNPILTYYSSGLLGTDQLQKEPYLFTIAKQNSSVGRYIIDAKDADAGQNYNIEYHSGVLDIWQKNLEAKVNDCEREYNQENPHFTITYNGFVCDDDENAISVKPTIYTEATSKSPTGTYNIYAKNGNSQNYNIRYNPGILTIKKANQNINWEQNFSNIKVGDQIELLAEATSGLPIEYKFSSANAEAYNIGEKQYLDCQKAGEITISAAQSGNYNYNAALRCSKTFVINPATGIQEIHTEENDILAYYDVLGHKLPKPQKGIMIVLYKNGKRKTVLSK